MAENQRHALFPRTRGSQGEALSSFRGGPKKTKRPGRKTTGTIKTHDRGTTRIVSYRDRSNSLTRRDGDRSARRVLPTGVHDLCSEATTLRARRRAFTCSRLSRGRVAAKRPLRHCMYTCLVYKMRVGLSICHNGFCSGGHCENMSAQGSPAGKELRGGGAGDLLLGQGAEATV